MRSPATTVGAFYFCIFGALGAFFPFLPVMLERRGLDRIEVGVAMVMVPVCNLLVPPLWGVAADLVRSRALMLRLASVGCAATVWLLLPAWGMAGSMAAIGIMGLFRAPMPPIADVTTRVALSDRPERYGVIRAWGGIGFAVTAAIVGGLGGADRPSTVIGATSALYVAAAIVALWLPRRDAGHARGNVTGVARRHILQPAFILFLAGTAIYYVAHATNDIYLSIHMTTLGVSQGLIGLAWSIGVATEVALMLAAPRFVLSVGTARLLPACALVAALRWTLLGQLTSVTGILICQILHGVTFGVWYLALVETAQSDAPAEARSTIQTAASAAVGFGMLTGYLIGGLLMHEYGSSVMYSVAAGISLAAAAIYMMGLRE